MPHVVIATDKFKGSATAAEVAAAVGGVARAAGWTTDEAPVSDGGEGFCSVLGGRPRSVTVRGPLGEPVAAAWYELERGTAAVEMAMASGLDLVGGKEHNDPVSADTAGTGELIAAAVQAGSRRILVGMGGSATTDGGWGALQVLEPHSRLAGVEFTVACDVTTNFVDAAATFSPQKGASPAQAELLTRRLERLAQLYLDRFGIDVNQIAGSGAAGGLAGGLAALGATLMAGFDLVADRVDLAARIEGADLVVTGEGLLDGQSFHGKVVGGVIELAREAAVRVVVVAGDSDGEFADVDCRTLVGAVGADRAMGDPLGALAQVAGELFGSIPTG